MPLSRSALLNGVEPPRIERKYRVDKPDELTKESIGFELGQDVNGPNATARKKLAEEWKLLSPTDKTRLRAIRAKRGISCTLCGNVGFYRENCPNKCAYRPDSPDSMDSTPPVSPREEPPTVGVLWGDLGFGPRKDEDAKPKLDTLRPQMLAEKRHLKESDARFLSHEFLSNADSGYYRSNAELNLHQVLRNMMRVLERLLRENEATLSNKVDKTLLVPPIKMPGNTFYPEALNKDYKQYRDYYYAKLAKESRKQKAHMFRGNSRSEDALDAVLRGGGGQEYKLYEPDPDACKSVHSKLGWKNILSKSDALANSDPDQVHKDKQVKALFEQQGEWSRLQKKAMEYKNDRFEHFVIVLRQELEAEHMRENKILLTETARDEQQLRATGFLQQLEAVDRILRTAGEYQFTAGTEEMDYLLFQLKTWKEANDKGGIRRRKRRWDQRLQYEQAGLPIPKKLWKITNKDKERGYGPDGTMSLAAIEEKQKMAEAAAAAGRPIEQLEEGFDSTDSTKAKQLPNGLQRTVPPHPRPKKVAGKKTGGTGLAAAVGGVSPYEMTSIDIIVHKRPGQKEKEKEAKRLAKLKKKEELDKAKADIAGVKDVLSQAGSEDGSQGDDSSQSSLDSGAGLNDVSVGSFGTDSQLGSDGLPWKGPSAFELSAGRARQNFQEWSMREAEKTSKKAYKKARKVREREMAEKERARRHAEARGEFQRAKDAKKNKFASNVGVLEYKPTAAEIDEKEMKVVSDAFEEAGFGTHIRDGGYEQANLHKMPALIPVPKTFNDPGGPELRLKSYAAEKVMEGTRVKLVDPLSGHVRTQLLPLYVRNTLIEHNGTSVGGDQTQEVLRKDRRYNHTYGRAVAVFEKTEGGALSAAERELRAKGPVKKHKVKTNKKDMVTGSLVNMAFKKQSLYDDT